MPVVILTLSILFWASFFEVVYSYGVYPVILQVLATLFGRSPTRIDASAVPTVGVVVPVFNEESVIHGKIGNLLALDYPGDKISIWIGSDFSNDRTHEIVQSIGDPRVRLWISPERIGKTGVLNRVAPQVESDIILFTDANTIHEPRSLRIMVRHYADPRVGGVAGHIRHMVTSGGGFGETIYRAFETRQKLLESRLHSTISAYGGFYSIRKELFRPIPPNAYSNDDVLIPMDVIRQNRRMLFDPGAVSTEELTEDVRSEFSRRIRIGAGNFQAFSWLLDFFNPFRGWPAFCYVSHKASRWFSPVFLCLALVSCTLLALLPGGILPAVMLGIFAGIVVLGLSSLLVPNTFTGRILYFFIMNTALLIGLFRFAVGIRSAAWNRTERREDANTIAGTEGGGMVVADGPRDP